MQCFINLCQMRLRKHLRLNLNTVNKNYLHKELNTTEVSLRHLPDIFSLPKRGYVEGKRIEGVTFHGLLT